MKSQLTEVMKRGIEENNAAGMSVLVMRKGKELCFLSEGYADLEAGRKVERDTIFRLYSQTKPITAAAAVLLMERGLLDLYEPVSTYLPGFAHQKVWENGENRDVLREMTIKDLLQMTSGTCYPDVSTESGRQAGEVFQEVDERLYTDHPVSTVDFANSIGKCSLLFDPGESWNYGTSADILGAVIEIITGIPFGDFLEKEFFEPLGMTDTGFWVPAEKQERLCQTYDTVVKDGKKQLEIYKGNHLGIMNRMERKPAFESGGAGLASTLDDYSRFAAMLLNGGEWNGKRILKKPSVKFLTGGRLLERQQVPFENYFGFLGYSYGNLMRVCKHPSQGQMFCRKGEYGWDGWLGTHFFNLPKEKVTILIGVQNGSGAPATVARKLKNVILSEI